MCNSVKRTLNATVHIPDQLIVVFELGVGEARFGHDKAVTLEESHTSALSATLFRIHLRFVFFGSQV